MLPLHFVFGLWQFVYCVDLLADCTTVSVAPLVHCVVCLLSVCDVLYCGKTVYVSALS